MTKTGWIIAVVALGWVICGIYYSIRLLRSQRMYAERCKKSYLKREDVEDANKVTNYESISADHGQYGPNKAMRLPANQYIVNYDIWQGAKCVDWGNTTLVSEAHNNVGELIRQMQETAKNECGLDNASIRIVGLFKL